MRGMLLPTMMTVALIHHHLLLHHLTQVTAPIGTMTMMTNTKEYAAVVTAVGTIVFMATMLYATTIQQAATMA